MLVLVCGISIIVAFQTVTLSVSFAQNDFDKFYPNIRDVGLDIEKKNLFDDAQFAMNVSSSSTKPNSWSSLIGDEIEVKDGKKYIIISNMGLNSYVNQSHIAIYAFNQTSQEWKQVTQCPNGLEGPLKMQRFVCDIEIESPMEKIRPVFNAGWSTEKGQKAVTYFGDLYVIESEKNTPIVYDNNLKVQQVLDLSIIDPIAMNFLGPADILVADKNRGLVYEILNGTLTGPLLDVDVADMRFLGLNSIKTSNNTYVYVYYRESGTDANGDDPTETVKPKCNCLYRYELVDHKLINPELLFGFMTFYDSVHHYGGVIKIGPDNNVYLVTGELAKENYEIVPSKARNFINGPEPDGSSGVLRFTVDGDPVEGILGETYPLNLYYAYGIRNSFGMDFDPITGYLWDTENGDFHGDEINLVEPGFNSGHNKTAGIWHATNKSLEVANPLDLEDFQGKGKYSAPEFSWKDPVGPVALAFLDSTKLGNNYNNTMFVSDVNNKNIYNFKLNDNRTALDLVEKLEDKVANSTKELSSVVFASELGTVTDITVGPDGLLYLLSLDDKKLFRIVPSDYK